MYLIEAFFHATTLPEDGNYYPQVSAVNDVIDQWRYNGQIIGREIPVFLALQDNQQGFGVRLICPEEQSLLADFNNSAVTQALAKAEKCGVIFESFQVVGEDLNSDLTFRENKPQWQILYTTYLQVCSPLHSGDSLQPIPLYRQLSQNPALSMDIIKWQENWQACDQLQMNGTVLEAETLQQISETKTNLFKHGYALTKEIEEYTKIPTYYYLYRVGGKSLASEQARCCPQCGGDWALTEPLFDQFHFKCDKCRLVSNISWNWL